MTNAAPDPPFEEGPSTAAYDFNDARFRIHQVREEIHRAELNRRRWRVLLAVGPPALLVVLVTLNLARYAHSSPLHINLVVLATGDVVGGIALLALLAACFRSLSGHRDAIAKWRLNLAQLREAERDARTRMASGGLIQLLWTYHSDAQATIDDYRDHARKYRRIHNWYQTLIIVGSLSTTVATTAAAGKSPWELAATAFSFVVSVSAGITGYFKFRERSMNLQQAADELELEHKSAELGIRAYRKLEEEDRLVEFAQRAEGIKDEQRKREQQLEQPPEGNSASANTSNRAS